MENNILKTLSKNIQDLQKELYTKNIEYTREIEALNFEKDFNSGIVAKYVIASEISKEYMDKHDTENRMKYDYDTFPILDLLLKYRELKFNMGRISKGEVIEKLEVLDNEYTSIEYTEDNFINTMIREIEDCRNYIQQDFILRKELDEEIHQLIDISTNFKNIPTEDFPLVCENISLVQTIETIKAVCLGDIDTEEEGKYFPSSLLHPLLEIYDRGILLEKIKGEVNVDTYTENLEKIKTRVQDLSKKMTVENREIDYFRNQIERLEKNVERINSLKIQSLHNKQMFSFSEVYHEHIGETLVEADVNTKITPKRMRDIFDLLFLSLMGEYNREYIQTKIDELEYFVRHYTLELESYDYEKEQESAKYNFEMCKQLTSQLRLMENILEVIELQHKEVRMAFVSISDVRNNKECVIEEEKIADILENNKGMIERMKIIDSEKTDLEIYTQSKLIEILSNCAKTLK